MNQLFRRFRPSMVPSPFSFSSKKLGIADTAKVIQDKILNISQVVTLTSIQNDVKEFGTVISIGDGIARVVGLNKVQAG